MLNISFSGFCCYISIVKPHRNTAERLTLLLKKELTKSKLNEVKKTYLSEKIKMLGEFLVKKEK
jgi:hypothetical protein